MDPAVAVNGLADRPVAAALVLSGVLEIFTGTSDEDALLSNLSNHPSRYCRRQWKTWFVLISCARATNETDAPGFSVSSTICRLSSFDRNRRFRISIPDIPPR